MRIVITGATGFAGTHILHAFQGAGMSAGTVQAIPACRTRDRLPERWRAGALIGDYREQPTLEAITSGADVVVHAAAWAELNGTVQDSRENFLTPTVRLIDAAVRNGVKRFVFLSAVTSNVVEAGRVRCGLPLEDIWAHYASIMSIEAKLREVGDRMQSVVLRAGYFTGTHYGLGILPILLPRLRTHTVPWIERGQASFPLIDGADLGRAFVLAAKANLPGGSHTIEVIGKQTPRFREVLEYLNHEHGYPLPHFSVSVENAYRFARLSRALHRVLPGDPLIVPAVVLLLEECGASNKRARELLGYEPRVHWKRSIDLQLSEMAQRSGRPMRMNR